MAHINFTSNTKQYHLQQDTVICKNCTTTQNLLYIHESLSNQRTKKWSPRYYKDDLMKVKYVASCSYQTEHKK